MSTRRTTFSPRSGRHIVATVRQPVDRKSSNAPKARAAGANSPKRVPRPTCLAVPAASPTSHPHSTTPHAMPTRRTTFSPRSGRHIVATVRQPVDQKSSNARWVAPLIFPLHARHFLQLHSENRRSLRSSKRNCCNVPSTAVSNSASHKAPLTTHRTPNRSRTEPTTAPVPSSQQQHAPPIARPNPALARVTECTSQTPFARLGREHRTSQSRTPWFVRWVRPNTRTASRQQRSNCRTKARLGQPRTSAVCFTYACCEIPTNGWTQRVAMRFSPLPPVG